MTLYELIPETSWKFIDRRVGTPIWTREWDICCILDGCRVDTFRTIYPDAESYLSLASSSRQWIERTFDRDCSTIGLVTANPFAADLDPDGFAYLHLEPVRETKYGIETVPPDALVDRAASVWNERDRLGIEQLVIHFMQPHVPFRAKSTWFDRFLGSETWGSDVWEWVADGSINREAWFEAYLDNLQWVIDDGVRPLQDRADATIALTADHGNAAGEWGVAGHPPRAVTPEVRRVPWLTVDGEQRLEPPPLPEETGATFDRNEQLAALGYR